MKMVFAPELSVTGALNITGIRPAPANSVFVQVEGYRIVILLSVFTYVSQLLLLLVCLVVAVVPEEEG
jgi:hypothetical protein